MVDLPQRLRLARSLVELSARELDRLAGLAEGQTSLIENGSRSHVEAKTAQALARVLGVSLDWLIAGEGADPKADTVLSAVENARATYTKTTAA